MTLCCGIDFSTKRIDMAAIPLDPDEPGGPWKINGIGAGDRYGSVHQLVRDLLGVLSSLTRMDVVTVCVEQPAGKIVHHSMHELYGVIRAAIPPGIPSTGLYPSEWRKAIGVTTIGKAAGHARIHELYPGLEAWDEHELDALGTATAWRSIQWKETR